MKTYHCDKCGKEVSVRKVYEMEVSSVHIDNFFRCYGTYHLCKPCYNGIIKPLTKST